MSNIQSMRRFQENRFGAFIHYGLYSLLGRSELAMYNEAIPDSEYSKLAQRFTGGTRFTGILGRARKDGGCPLRRTHDSPSRRLLSLGQRHNQLQRSALPSR